MFHPNYDFTSLSQFTNQYECHLKHWTITWNSELLGSKRSLATFLHRLSVLLSYIESSHCAIINPTFCTLFTFIICLTRETLHQELRSNSWQCQSLAVCIPDTTWTSLWRLHPYNNARDVHTSVHKLSRQPVPSGWVDRIAPVVPGLIHPVTRPVPSQPAR